jgi:hypothetical protein
MFYHENGKLHIAESRDSQGPVGAWRKWYRGAFTEPGLDGRSTQIPDLATHPGSNPSLLWNTFLERWLMAWHGWGGELWISSNRDLMDWTPPKILLKKPTPPGEGLVSNLDRQFRQDRRRVDSASLRGIS